MNRRITLMVLALVLSVMTTSCAGQRINQRSAAKGAATAALIVGVLIMASQYSCGDCNIGPANDGSARR